MYKIYCDGKLLYDPRDEELPVMSGKLALAVNATGELSLALPPTHPGMGDIQKMKSVLAVYDDEKLLYEGRVTDSKKEMYGIVTYTCEGTMAYLLDSIQRPKEYHDLTPKSYLQDKLAQHNSQVEPEKRFVLCIVEKQAMNYDARQDNQYTSTLDTIMDKLVSSNGGYLRVRREKGIRYLDYLESYGRTSMQSIRFGENVLDLTEHISASELVTVLVPLGKSVEGANGGNGKRLTISSANNGKDYLEDADAIALYGRIVGTKTWDDVTVPGNLKAKGEEYLASARNLSMSIELAAVDLHLVDVDIDRIELGDMVRVISPPHGLDRYMFVSKREYNLLDPSADKITLGDVISTLTEKQAAIQKEVERQRNAAVSVEELKGSMAVLEGDMAATKGDVTSLGGKVQILETGATSTEEMLQELQNTVARMGGADAEMQQAIEEILKRLEKLEGGAGM